MTLSRRPRWLGPIAAVALSFSSSSSARGDDWTAAASMATPRAYQTATLLGDGRVLVTGGIPTTLGNQVLASADIFDPLAGAWSTTGSMSRPRFEHSAVLLSDGRVLVIGGQDWFVDNKTAEIFDPLKGTWSSALSMFETRYWSTATLLGNGEVLVVGGLHGGAHAALRTAERYNAATNTWAHAAPMARFRAFHRATLLASGKILVTGGAARWDTLDSRADAELYDPAANTWSPAAPMKESRASHTATLLRDGRVLVSGGMYLQNKSDAHASAEIYDPTDNTWAPAGTMITARAHHTAEALSNGQVLIAGGASSDGAALDSAEIWSPTTTTWSPAGQMSAQRDYSASVPLGEGRVLELGGKPSDSSTSWASADVYALPSGAPCGDASECPSGHCVNSVCCSTACDESACDVCAVAAGAAVDGVCSHLPSSGSSDCAPGCLSAHDCPSPTVCNEAGQCVAPPPVVSDNSGCSAATPSPAPCAPWSAAAALALLTAARRRRRRQRSPA